MLSDKHHLFQIFRTISKCVQNGSAGRNTYFFFPAAEKADLVKHERIYGSRKHELYEIVYERTRPDSHILHAQIRDISVHQGIQCTADDKPERLLPVRDICSEPDIFLFDPHADEKTCKASHGVINDHVLRIHHNSPVRIIMNRVGFKHDVQDSQYGNKQADQYGFSEVFFAFPGIVKYFSHDEDHNSAFQDSANNIKERMDAKEHSCKSDDTGRYPEQHGITL